MSYKEQGFTDIITDKHPAKELLCVIDENGMPIKKVQTYNTKTKEVTVYRYGPDNKPMWDSENSSWLTDTYIAYGSRIVFKEMQQSRPSFTEIGNSIQMDMENNSPLGMHNNE